MAKIDTIIGITQDGVATMFDNAGEFLCLDPDNHSTVLLAKEKIVIAISDYGDSMSSLMYGGYSFLSLAETKVRIRAKDGVHLLSDGEQRNSMVLGEHLSAALQSLVEIFTTNAAAFGISDGKPVTLSPNVVAALQAWVASLLDARYFLSNVHTVDRGRPMFPKGANEEINIEFNEESIAISPEIANAFELTSVE